MTEPEAGYTPARAQVIEAKWQHRWRESRIFHADNPTGALAGPKAAREAEFVLDMFPYPSGSGLHVGHPLGFIATDVYARYQRSEGKNVLYTMGFDAFGLPAEQFAVQTGIHPGVATRDNIERYRRQLERLGMSHDERRSLATTEPSYYKWTQWVFLQLYGSWFDPEVNRARAIATLIPRLRARLAEAGLDWDNVGRARQEELLGEYRLAYRKESEVN
ncbi:class I tRNA ligase family protein [Lysobacter korlensis]|uniref:leucine--tRNA ligase n=1 Tax=Lysobacter korlensis TaxID=553636 RepID=A0ABV6RV26_9GAMM